MRALRTLVLRPVPQDAMGTGRQVGPGSGQPLRDHAIRDDRSSEAPHRDASRRDDRNQGDPGGDGPTQDGPDRGASSHDDPGGDRIGGEGSRDPSVAPAPARTWPRHRRRRTGEDPTVEVVGPGGRGGDAWSTGSRLHDQAGRGAESHDAPDDRAPSRGRRVRRTGGRGRRGGAIGDTAPAPDVPHVVLVPADRAVVAGAAVAALVPRRPGQGAVVLAFWDPRGGWPATEGAASTGTARRTAGRVSAAGVDGLAVGRTVRVDLPADDAQAVAAVERLEATSGLGPVVVIVAGAWGAPFLGLVERTGVVHADGGPAAVEACGRTLARHGVDVHRVPDATGPVARMLLRAGWIGRAQVRRPPGARDPADGPSVAALRGRGADEAGQSMLLILGALLVALVLAGVLGAVASAMGGREDRQRAVDLAALAAADRMRGDWSARAGAPPTMGADRYRERATASARRAAAANDLQDVQVTFPDPEADAAGPLTVRVRAPSSTPVAGVTLGTTVEATAELSPPALPVEVTSGDEYDGPLARRQGKPMRPDVAIAFDRMNAAATAAGRPLTVTSGFRSNAEQARLFAEHPDPKWVARPGTSLHRLGTELDLGPPAAYGWLAANSARFGFKRRYSWEPWHFGYVRDTGSSHVADQGRNPRAAPRSGALPGWTPARFRPTILAASVRFKVSAALLAAQLKQESGFDPVARSPAGAQGIAQFMPGTAAAMGLRDPFDPEQAIHAQAKLMSLLLRRFGSVQLALAAYNAGEGNVAPCGCIPPFPETRHYVATIVALMKGYDPAGGLADVLAIRLVR